MNTTKECERLFSERKLFEKYCTDFKMYSRYGIRFFSGWITTKLNKYKLRLLLDKKHPYAAPKLFLVSPKVLYTYDGKSLNSLGVSYRFHTVRDVPSDYIQISYPMIWEPCCTCVKVIIGGIVWINLYEEHLRTGKDFKWL